jgi:hypothetical protein
MSGSIKGEGSQTQLNHYYLLEKRLAQLIYCHRNYFHFLFQQLLQWRGSDEILNISLHSPAFKNITSIVKHFLGCYNVTRLRYSKFPPPSPDFMSIFQEFSEHVFLQIYSHAHRFRCSYSRNTMNTKKSWYNDMASSSYSCWITISPLLHHTTMSTYPSAVPEVTQIYCFSSSHCVPRHNTIRTHSHLIYVKNHAAWNIIKPSCLNKSCIPANH